jgi:lambda family phage portal protein
MKRSLLNRVIGMVSPEAEYRRTRYQKATELVRDYDAASIFNSGDWSTARGTSATSEVRGALTITRDRSRDLVRNSPYANKALNVIVSNTVGAGLVPKIKGRTKTQTERVTKEWKTWAETTLCDYDGYHNFNGLQALALRSTTESGEVIARKMFSAGVAKLQLLESDFINPNFNNMLDNVQGLWLDDAGRVIGYELYERHPGDYRSLYLKSFRIPSEEIIHMFKRERAGQLRGMPWAYPVATAIKDFADFQNATLVRQKVAACVTAFITEKDGDGLLDSAKLRTQREADNAMEPGAVRYLAQGQTMQLASPPGVDQYDPFARQSLRAIAAGFGISYESLTGDYSQVNFSSGRMGHLEMQRNIDMWRWQMLIPQFCEPSFQHFLKWCSIRGIDVTGVTASWTCPAREMIDPTKELAALKDEVRSGFKPLPEAIRERGLDPDAVLEEAAEFNKKLDAMGLIFDTDPRKITSQGMMQMTSEPAEPADPNAANGDTNSANETNASKPSGKSGAKQS